MQLRLHCFFEYFRAAANADVWNTRTRAMGRQAVLVHTTTNPGNPTAAAAAAAVIDDTVTAAAAAAAATTNTPVCSPRRRWRGWLHTC
jgi:adenosylmethionine-8-amino-7-oxononanoate aminotransferase